MKIIVLGAGNIAKHLAHSLHALHYNIVEVYNRTACKGQALADSVSATYVSQIASIDKNADLYIIAVSDHYIPEIAAQLSSQINGIVIHTSGATPLSVLDKFKRSGVIYPVQSIHDAAPTDLQNIPYAIEGNRMEVQEKLLHISSSISLKTFICNSPQRLAIHVAAVFVNNFSNALYTIANEILSNNGISFEVLHPLLMKTAENAKDLPQNSIQTGPAVRNDIKTIDMHLDFLSDTKDLAEIYQKMTDYIIKCKQKEKSN